MTQGPFAEYQMKLAAGDLQMDQAQSLVIGKLQDLSHALDGYQLATGSAGWKEWFGFSALKNSSPQGIYIFGGVGRGKSMVMDMFFKAAPIERKRRVHFHAFMQQVHERLADIRLQSDFEGDPIPPLAERLAGEAWLLCFDEFQIQDIADAMILGRLFEALFQLGVVVVATANIAPADLYKDGLQRELFLPFIDLLEANLQVLKLDGNIDYRLKFMRDEEIYLMPVNEETESRLTKFFHHLINDGDAMPEIITVQGRQLEVPLCADGVAMMGFRELCEQPLGAADYLLIAKRYHTLVLPGIPCLSPEKRNEAKRFVTLIDALYEHKVNLICSAEALPEKLYPEGNGSQEFKRTASRLVEMQSDDYMMKRHLGRFEKNTAAEN